MDRERRGRERRKRIEKVARGEVESGDDENGGGIGWLNKIRYRTSKYIGTKEFGVIFIHWDTYLI